MLPYIAIRGVNIKHNNTEQKSNSHILVKYTVTLQNTENLELRTQNHNTGICTRVDMLQSVLVTFSIDSIMFIVHQRAASLKAQYNTQSYATTASTHVSSLLPDSFSILL